MKTFFWLQQHLSLVVNLRKSFCSSDLFRKFNLAHVGRNTLNKQTADWKEPDRIWHKIQTGHKQPWSESFDNYENTDLIRQAKEQSYR